MSKNTMFAIFVRTVKIHSSKDVVSDNDSSEHYLKETQSLFSGSVPKWLKRLIQKFSVVKIVNHMVLWRCCSGKLVDKNSLRTEKLKSLVNMNNNNSMVADDHDNPT